MRSFRQGRALAVAAALASSVACTTLPPSTTLPSSTTPPSTTLSPLPPPQSLGGGPLCEASAARVVPCEQGDCLLIGDNEDARSLFLVPIAAAELQVDQRQEVALPVRDDDGVVKSKISDIEALMFHDMKVVIVGSHSRNSECDKKRRRRQLGSGNWNADNLDSTAYSDSQKISCEKLFGDAADSGPLKSVCEAIKASETAADEAFAQVTEEERKKACASVQAFNIEGAVALGDGTQWIGLRAPLVADDAVLLRRKGDGPLQADHAVFLDLGGRGVRELSRQGDRIWGIAGPPTDKVEDFLTFWFPASDLDTKTTITPEVVRDDLPYSSEGMAIHNGSVFIVIDGEQKKDTDECILAAKWLAFPVRLGATPGGSTPDCQTRYPVWSVVGKHWPILPHD